MADHPVVCKEAGTEPAVKCFDDRVGELLRSKSGVIGAPNLFAAANTDHVVERWDWLPLARERSAKRWMRVQHRLCSIDFDVPTKTTTAQKEKQQNQKGTSRQARQKVSSIRRQAQLGGGIAAAAAVVVAVPMRFERRHIDTYARLETEGRNDVFVAWCKERTSRCGCAVTHTSRCILHSEEGRKSP